MPVTASSVRSNWDGRSGCLPERSLARVLDEFFKERWMAYSLRCVIGCISVDATHAFAKVAQTLFLISEFSEMFSPSLDDFNEFFNVVEASETEKFVPHKQSAYAIQESRAQK